jgi:hypothetical protein
MLTGQGVIDAAPMDVDKLDQPIADRRARRENRQLPRRYQDIQPNPPAALPPPPAPPLPTGLLVSSLSAPQASPVRKIFKSTHNVFGLFRQYYATHFPEHDPDEILTSEDLMDTPHDTLPDPPTDSYHPYPNRSSFLLGEWYWDDGANKTQSNFKHLLDIIGQSNFQPGELAEVNWKRIDAQLRGESRGTCDEGGDDGWEDESICGDWIKTPIKINVPFHKRLIYPGKQEFEAGVLYHRKLVSVIREKISRTSSYPHLHLEPYELYWQPNQASEPVRVHSELYSSKAFVDAHYALQDSPNEPGCDLPKVIVALMFASDGTQLTTFSDAKLWPLYLGIGNESKYRRSKPSCKAFEHVAYFASVSKLLGYAL